MTARRREITLAEAQDMMASVPADDRDAWLQVGMALHHEYGDAAWGVWDQWSQTSDRYDPRAARATWRSFGDAPAGRAVTIGTLIHLAREHGYRPTDPPNTRPPARAPERPPEALPKRSDTTGYALRLWMAADRTSEAVKTHPYAVAKGIDWHAGAGRVQASGRVIGRDADCLVIPIRENATGRVQGVQVINPAGAKQTFGQLSGGALLLGNDLDKSIPWAVLEGWADAVTFTFHWHHGNAVGVCAFGKGRMDDVARMIDERYRPREVLVIHDAEGRA